MSGRQSLSGQQKTGKRDPGSSRRSPGNTSAGSAAARQTAASRPVSSERRAEESKTAKNRYQETYRQPENSGQRSKRSSIYTDPAKRKAKKKKRKIQIILLEAVLFLTVLVFAGYSYLNSRLGMIQRLPWDPDEIRNIDISEEKQEQMKGYWTIAIFGVDSRNSSVGKGNNSDVNILCNINQDTGEIKLVSVFRDSYLNVNDKNSYNKINAAYLQGGPEQAVKALNKNLDLDIDDYATFNWKAVADAINILGGIDVEITKAEFYYINAFISETVKATGIGSYQLKQAGMNHLDGVQAVAYGRLRLMDTDYARTERQRKVIALAFEKAKKADWATLNCIIQTVFPQVATSVDIGDLLTMGRSITKYHLTETMGFPAARGEKSIKGKGACVIPQTLESNVIELHKFLFGDENYQPTETVKTISRKISADSGLSTDAKPVGEVGTGGGSIPKTTAEAASEESTQEERSEEETEESGEAGESEGEGEAGELEGSEGNHAFPYGYPGYTTEQETDSGGNLILPSGGYEEEESTRGWWERPWGSQNETGERESRTEGLFSGPSEAAGTGAVRPGSQTDTGVILAPGMTVPAD